MRTHPSRSASAICTIPIRTQLGTSLRELTTGYNESSNGKLKDELVNREIFYSLREAQVLVEQWHREYNTIRPHSYLGFRPPAPQAVLPTGSWLGRPVLQGPRLAAGLTQLVIPLLGAGQPFLEWREADHQRSRSVSQ